MSTMKIILGVSPSAVPADIRGLAEEVYYAPREHRVVMAKPSGEYTFERAATGVGHQAVTIVRVRPKIPRNDPCPCGSGQKYKHCHLLLEKEGR